jgi:hypothetical protein
VTKHATEVSIIKSVLAWHWGFIPVFVYETKFKREQLLKLPKPHYYDAVAICCAEHHCNVQILDMVLIKKHYAKGDYQQTKGPDSKKRIPTNKLFGLRKFDLIKTDQGVGFLQGKRSKGYFALMDILGKKITASVNIKKNMVRLSALTTTLTQLRRVAIHLGSKQPSSLA